MPQETPEKQESAGDSMVGGAVVDRVPLATAGLFVAWMANDLEELATMSDNSRALVTRLPDWIPVPASVRQGGFTARYVATAIPSVGLVVAAASVHGYRTQGRSAFYQNALLGFGLHGLGHIGLSLWRAAIPVALPRLLRWSSQSGRGQPGRYGQAGVPNRRSLAAAIALVAGSLSAGHLAAYLITKNQP